MSLGMNPEMEKDIDVILGTEKQIEDSVCVCIVP